MDGAFSRVLFFCALALASTACKPEDSRGEYLEDRQSKVNPVGESCADSDDPQKICLALHYVVYENDAGQPVVDAAGAAENVRQVNEMFASCGIAFQIDNFDSVKPSEHGLEYSTSTFEGMDQARVAFGEKDTLLSVTTGDWSGDLRAAGANAWTQPPQANVWGVVMEARVGTYSNILGHELGHYLDLEHVQDQANLLNPVVYSSSRQIDSAQCQTMRTAAIEYWTPMQR